MKKKLSVAKFGGSLLDVKGKGLPKIIEHIKKLKKRDDIGPVVVFSAPMGCTDELIRIGEAQAQSTPINLNPVFDVYNNIAKSHLESKHLENALADLANFRSKTQEALTSVNKRFNGNVRARILTFGGELTMSALAEHILKFNKIDSSRIPIHSWPVVTDDNFEEATPDYEMSKKRASAIISLLEEGKVVCLAGFLGVTADGLETVLGRGGSDLTAVFASCLLKGQYQTDTLLFKDIPIQSADPKVVKGQETNHVAILTYNEAHKASMMGMKILQSPAIAMARRFMHPLRVVPIDQPEKYSLIQSKTKGGEIVKCLTGKTGAAILSMNDEKSHSLEDSLRIWEKRNDFMDLGAETLETGERIRDFLFLDSDFLKRNEEKIKGFDENLKIEYGLGVVTLIGDKMKDSPGVASIAIGAISGTNIKRGIFAPHTSQIIIVVEEKNVNATVAAIHLRKDEMNKPIH